MYTVLLYVGACTNFCTQPTDRLQLRALRCLSCCSSFVSGVMGLARAAIACSLPCLFQECTPSAVGTLAACCAAATSWGPGVSIWVNSTAPPASYCLWFVLLCSPLCLDAAAPQGFMYSSSGSIPDMCAHWYCLRVGYGLRQGVPRIVFFVLCAACADGCRTLWCVASELAGGRQQPLSCCVALCLVRVWFPCG